MTVSLKLDEATHQKVVTIAALKDKTPHWIMCNAVKRYVEHEEKLQEFRQAALQAHQQIQEGHFISDELVDEWLASWGTENEQDAPQCR